MVRLDNMDELKKFYNESISKTDKYLQRDNREENLSEIDNLDEFEKKRIKQLDAVEQIGENLGNRVDNASALSNVLNNFIKNNQER